MRMEKQDGVSLPAERSPSRHNADVLLPTETPELNTSVRVHRRRSVSPARSKRSSDGESRSRQES
jgi:hypothetical protein